MTTNAKCKNCNEPLKDHPLHRLRGCRERLNWQAAVDIRVWAEEKEAERLREELAR